MIKKLNKIYCTLGLAALVIGMATSAHATLYYQIQGGLNGTYGNLEYVNVTFGGNNSTVLAGGINITKNQSVSSGPGPVSYVSLCTDFLGTLYLGSTYSYNNPVGVSGLVANSAPNGIAGLVNYPAPTWGSDGSTAAEQKAINNAAEIFYHNYSILTTSSLDSSASDAQAALQMAIWTALYDTDASGDVTGVMFQADSLSGLVNGYLSGLDGTFSGPVSLLVPNPINQGNGDGEPPQGLLVLTPVPEASTAVAGGLLLLPFALCSLKSFRKSRI